MSEVQTASTDVLKGVIVNYPSAIPTKQWLVSNLLWAERLGSIWPTHIPVARNARERETLNDIRRLMETEPDLFTPFHVAASADQLIDELTRYLEVDETKRREWLTENDLDDVSVGKARKREADPELFFYVNKMPPDVVDALLESGIAHQPAGKHAIELRDKDHADVLMSLLAKYAQPSTGDMDSAVVLDAATPTALGVAAAPTDQSPVAPALRVEIPAIRAANDDVSIDRLLDFRTSSKGGRLRREYVQVTSHRLQELRDAPVDDATHLKEVVRSIRQDVVGTRDQLAGGLTAAGIATAVASTAGMILPVAVSPQDFSSWAGLALSSAAKGLGFTHSRVTASPKDDYMRTIYRKSLVR
ncbi:hypothetical protein [Nocardioides sp. Soil805]|uniref:hypothetical protein n=1 Tax=Nocardioides sp. Soil805 TaxID=1736416 RepID=UPI000702A56D|nr:hypothetical protein [Nocardioides sp. Soil805]KRF37365.1 hypothetical protein ASG94_08570 [Nocardioides sp. Soil805]